MTNPIAEKATLQATFRQLEKKYGKGIIMKLGEQQQRNIPTVSTGSLGLNDILGIGGLPYGRIVEIYGPESSGKTTLAMHVIAEIQKKGKTALLIDAEHAFDKKYAKSLGIDVKNLLICQPDYGEQALDVAEHCIKSEAVKLVVIDSVSALVPEAELKGDIGAHNVGGQARLMSQVMRKLTAIIHKTGAICLFINQLRHKIGITFGSPETTSGGNALKFYASIRLDVRNIGAIKDKNNNRIGQRTRVKVVKNKLAAPFGETIFEIRYGQGISYLGEIVSICLSLGILATAGSWFSYGEKRLAQGKEAMTQLLKDDLTLRKSLLENLAKQMQQANTPI